MSEKRLDAKNRWRNVVVAFRMSPEEAHELLDDIEAKWLKKHKPKNPNSFTEQLQLRTQTRMMAEEIVIMDVVMQFH